MPFDATLERWLRVVEVSALMGRTERGIRKACSAGRFRARTVPSPGGKQYEIQLKELPEAAQFKYFASQVKQQTPAERRAHLLGLNLEEVAEREVARLAGVPRKARKLAPLPLTHEEAEAIDDAFSRAPGGVQKEARRRLVIMQAYTALLLIPDIKGSKVQALEEFARQQGESAATIRRWHDAVKHLQGHQWLSALAPKWRGNTARAEFSDEAWAYIRSEWAAQSKPALKVIYRRAKKLAAADGWALPTYTTVKRRMDAEPLWWKTLVREGLSAMTAMFPAAQRDYSAVDLHGIWCSDGRKADVFVRFEDGSVGRPIIVGWEDIRSRMILGWHLSNVENADVIRRALRNAVERSKALPTEALLDNGRGYASKLMTGGQATRFRFKIKEDDIPGILTMLDVKVIWATPGHGQAKPIESFWRTTAQTDKRAEFAGAYCGNKPDAKPEDFDSAKAVPVAQYAAALQEDIEAYNQREHRGDSMDGRSPAQVYAELLPSTTVRHPTAAQLRLCMLAAENVKLDSDGAFYILQNRYWNEQVAALQHRGPYVARFDPEDPMQPIALYDGERYLFEVPLVAKTGFRDQEAGKAHNRARNTFRKAKKLEAKSLKEMDDAMRWDAPGKTAGPDAGAGVAMPVPNVVAPLRPVTKVSAAKQKPVPEDGAITQEEFVRLFAAGLEKLTAKQRQQDDDFPRVAGGSR